MAMLSKKDKQVYLTAKQHLEMAEWFIKDMDLEGNIAELLNDPVDLFDIRYDQYIGLKIRRR